MNENAYRTRAERLRSSYAAIVEEIRRSAPANR